MKEYDKFTIANNFSKAAENYDNFAPVQKLSAQKLCKITLPLIRGDVKIIDLGSGTSAIAKELANQDAFLQKKIHLNEVDLSQKMLKQWQSKDLYKINSIRSDIENLPFKKSSCDLIISSFALQWINNFDKVLEDLYQILKKDGMLSFCLPNNSSLEEIKSISLKSNCNFSFNNLPKVEEIKNSVAKTSFKEEFYFTETIKSDFINPLQALKSIKKIGANYTNHKNFVSKKQLKEFNKFSGDKFTISWNVSYLVLRKI